MESKEEIKEEINEAGKTIQKSLLSFLSNKPIWVFWIAYTVLCGILFAYLYRDISHAHLWWIPAIVVIVIGMTWERSYIRKTQISRRKKAGKKKV